SSAVINDRIDRVDAGFVADKSLESSIVRATKSEKTRRYLRVESLEYLSVIAGCPQRWHRFCDGCYSRCHRLVDWWCGALIFRAFNIVVGLQQTSFNGSIAAQLPQQASEP